MGCAIRADEEDERRSQSSSLVNDALLLTTMCLIGISVDVYIKDGSVYSGIFHTACVDDRYAIVLKRAKMIKKGSCNSNVASEEVIGTLIIQSEDLVQVVAKKVILPADGVAGHETGDVTGAVACSLPSSGTPLTEANKTSTSKSNFDQPHANQTRCSSETENGFANGLRSENAIQSTNALEIKVADARGSTKKEANKTSTSKSNVDQPHANQTRCSSETDNGFANGLRSENAIHSTNVLEIKIADARGSTKKEEGLNDPGDNRKNGNHTSSSEPVVSLSTPSETVASKVPNSNRATKDSKLNPGAKIFSPSFPNKRSPTPPAMATGPNLAYIPNTYPGVPVASPQPEVEISSFAPRSLPVKFVPYGGNDLQHPPPIVGYMTNRSQPVRYGGPYHPIQTAPTYVQPSPQNVMVGRLGPVVYVHPVSQDMVPNTNGFSQVSCNILTPHQVHVPKHQGTATAQALQLCAGPPFLGSGGGQAPFVLPSHIPISQPHYPVMRPISVPGSNGFLVSKFS